MNNISKKGFSTLHSLEACFPKKTIVCAISAIPCNSFAAPITQLRIIEIVDQ